MLFRRGFSRYMVFLFGLNSIIIRFIICDAAFLQSVDGKITAGAGDALDFDRDFP